MPTTRHPSHPAGRFRHDMTPEWFDLLDADEAAVLLGGSDSPADVTLGRARLRNLRAKGLISAGDTSATHGPRWYRGDLERFAPQVFFPEDPISGGRALVLGGLIGLASWAIALGAAVIVKVLGR